MRRGKLLVKLSLVGGKPPTEFRVFRAGENTSTKGTVVFDEASAASVMASYEQHGVAVMIDLEHLSLESPEKSVNYDPDARGEGRLEVRNGELWVVGIEWTTDGAQRIREGTQRYISPAFFTDENGHVTELINVALCAQPATDNAQRLIAASRLARKHSMTKDALIKLLEALGLGELSEEQQAIVDAVFGASGEEETPAEEPAAADEPEEEPAAMADDPEEDEEEPAAAMAAQSRLLALTGKKTLASAVDEVVRREEKLARERSAFERGERIEFARLSVLSGMPPFLAWSDDKAKAPSQLIESMPIKEIRAKTPKLRELAKRSNGRAPVMQPPAGDGLDANGLTPEQLNICKETGCKPEVFARLKNRSAATAARS